jgi:hypothetical protein
MKRFVFVWMVVLWTLGMLCAGCVTSGPRSGTLGEAVPAPYGWVDYIERGGR